MSGLLNNLSNYGVRVVETPRESDFYLALDIRRTVYVDELKFRDANNIIDELDFVSTHLIVSGNTVGPIGSARMIPDNVFFEGEHYFDISVWRGKGKVAEIGRLSVLPEYRRSLAVIVMFRAFYRLALRDDIRFFFATGAEHVDALYQSLGFRKVGGPVYYSHCNNMSCAYILDFDAAMNEWKQRRPRMLEYFLQPIEGIG